MYAFRNAFIVGLAVLAGAASPVRAQSITPTDIERLQSAITDAGGDIDRLRSRDAILAKQLESQLSELSDEVIYLKVKIRKENAPVSRTAYFDLRDRIDDVRTRARGDSAKTGTSSGTGILDKAPTGSGKRSGEIPTGTELDVRLQTGLNSKTANVEDRFEATTMVDLMTGDQVLVPAGSVMRGVVTAVDPATRTDRKGSLTVNFDQLTVNGRAYPIRGTVAQALESSGIKGEIGKVGAGAGVGAIIGGIIGGMKGAMVGILIGAGGTVLATEGKDVDLPVGTVLRVRLDSAVTIR